MKRIGTGRVIESDNTTNIFVYFSDHGAPLMLRFPETALFADALYYALSEMNRTKRYNKIIMYIEACFAGSMFEDFLSEHTRVFVMTASARDEPSYTEYCNVPKYGSTCLGDAFSVSWLERMDKEGKGTFDQFFHQYQRLRIAVRKSHVQIYGDFSIGPNAMTPNNDVPIISRELLTTSVSASDVDLFYSKYKIFAARDMKSMLAAQKDFNDKSEGRKIAELIMKEILIIAVDGTPHLKDRVNGTLLPANLGIFPCYKNLIATLERHCLGPEHDYLASTYQMLANICILEINISRLLEEIPSLCAHPTWFV